MQTIGDTPHDRPTEVKGRNIIWQSLESRGFPGQLVDIMMKAQRDSTTKTYSGYLVKWTEFCDKERIDYFKPGLVDALKFLRLVFDNGSKQYSTVNTARSALSLIVMLPGYDGKFGEHPDVTRFMKAISQIKPARPRYIDTWDPDLVLKLFLIWSPASKLSLELLTMKTVMLTLLVSGKRPQIIRKLNVENMKIGKNSFTFYLDQTDLKEGRRGYKPEKLKLSKYPANKKLCIYTYLTKYLEATLAIRGTTKTVFLTVKKPYHTPSSDTVARWIKSVLNHAGVDTSHFSAASTRAASASKANRGGTPLGEIMRAAGWSRASTFTKFYNKPLTENSNFAKTVLTLEG